MASKALIKDSPSFVSSRRVDQNLQNVQSDSKISKQCASSRRAAFTILISRGGLDYSRRAQTVFAELSENN